MLRGFAHRQLTTWSRQCPSTKVSAKVVYRSTLSTVSSTTPLFSGGPRPSMAAGRTSLRTMVPRRVEITGQYHTRNTGIVTSDKESISFWVVIHPLHAAVNSQYAETARFNLVQPPKGKFTHTNMTSQTPSKKKWNKTMINSNRSMWSIKMLQR